MEFNSWIAFVIGTIIVCGTPGPNMLQVMNCSIRYGMKPALFTMLGCFSGVYMLFIASMLGVGAFLQEFPSTFDILRYSGAAYLIYIGIMAWKESRSSSINPNVPALRSNKHIFRDGFLVGISNPKAMLFAMAFFPQFINPNEHQAIQFVILLSTFAVIEIAWYMLYALGGSKLASVMKKQSFRKLFDRFTVSLFIMFGIFLIAKPR